MNSSIFNWEFKQSGIFLGEAFEPPPLGFDIPQSFKETVLVVEDEPAMLDLVKDMFQRLGYVVLGSNTPSNALQIAKEHKGNIQLLMTDVVMPEMNGLELAEKIKAIRPGIKCLFMSGYTANAFSQQDISNIQLLQKPFTKYDLAIKVREVMDRA